MAVRTENVIVSFDRGGAKAMERLARAIEQSNQIEIDKERHRRAEKEKAAEKARAAPTGCDEHCPVHEVADDESGEVAEDVSYDYTVIGPECFVDGVVISYKGENYYKSCDAFVYDREDGGQSFCVLRVNHHGTIHEAYDGKLRDGK
jgi:phosphoribosylpyrophosphate synthetase